MAAEHWAIQGNPRVSWRLWDCSLCPVAAVQLPPAVWEGSVEPVATGHQPLTRITRLTVKGQRRFTELAALQAAVEAILTRARVQGVLAVQ